MKVRCNFLKAILFPLAAAALLVGCSFSVPDSSPEERGSTASARLERNVLLSGSISFSGAIPSAFKSNSSARTAFPTAPTSLVYKIKATSGSTVIEINSSETTTSGSITVGASDITYSINLSSGTWALTASAVDSSDKKVLATTEAVTVIVSEDAAAIDPLVLTYAKFSSVGKGGVNLTISCDTDSNIQSIKVNALTSGLTSTQSDTVDTWNWSQTNVAPGSYNVEFIFYSGTSCSGEVLYHIKEVVNVYSNLITDTFEAGAAYVSGGNIQITKALVDAAELTTFYVSSSGSDSGTGSYFNPVKTLEQAITLVNNSSAPASTEFEVLVKDNVSLGSNVTLNSGKKASISSEGSSAVTVSGGASHNSLTIHGEADVSNLNFTGLGGISVFVSGAKLTINDSTVKDGTCSTGGGIFVGSGTELVSEHGLVIKDCEATGTLAGSGGGIYNAGTVTLDGCKISGCTADVKGSSIYSLGSITLKGETSIDGSVYLQSNAHPLELDSSFSIPTGTDAIQIELKTDSLSTDFTFGDTVISSATAEQADCFTTPTDSGYSLQFVATSSKLIMNSGARFIIYVGGTGASDETGDGSNASPFATLEKSLEIAVERYNNEAGEYKIIVKDTIELTSDIVVEGLPDLTITGNVASTSTASILINGNGKKIQFNCDTTLKHLEFKSLEASSISYGPITIASGVEVEAEYVKVTDCTNTNGDGGGIFNAGTLTLTNCNISGCEATYNASGQGFGGGIYSESASRLTLEDTTVSGNTAALGGGIYIGYSCNAQITDSIIESNTANSTILDTFGGGGIFINEGGSLTLSGSTSEIKQNTAGSSTNIKNPYGGGVLCRGSMTMEGGTISQNKVIHSTTTDTGYGGGIALEPTSATSSGTFTMSGGTITNNEADFGGGIANRGLNLALSGGAINGLTPTLGNKASNGGGLYIGPLSFGLSSTPKVVTNTISDCSIECNTASSCGGGIFIEDSTLSFTAGSVSYNTVSTSSNGYVCGGGIYVKNGTLNFGGTATIDHNSVSTTYATGGAVGGGLYIYENGIVNMDGGSMNLNTVTSPIGTGGCSQGGGIYVFTGGTLNLSDGTIKENKAFRANTSSSGNTMGGGIFVYTGGTMTMTGGLIEENKALGSGGFAGGIYSFGSLSLTGGTITSNSAVTGGGIYLAVESGSTSSLNWGGTIITGNDATGFGFVGDNYYINADVQLSATIGAATYSGSPLPTFIQG